MKDEASYKEAVTNIAKAIVKIKGCSMEAAIAAAEDYVGHYNDDRSKTDGQGEVSQTPPKKQEAERSPQD